MCTLGWHLHTATVMIGLSHLSCIIYLENVYWSIAEVNACRLQNGTKKISNTSVCLLLILSIIKSLRLRRNRRHLQTTFSNAFSWMKMFKFRFNFHWSLFPRAQLTILSEPMLVSLPTHICVTRPQWVNPSGILIGAPRINFDIGQNDHVFFY